jgi:membrane associated rhomboid family serine protease
VSKLRITYNAPVVLTFALAAVAVHVATYVAGDAVRQWFVAYPRFSGVQTYVGLFSHILGHANWQHLMGNFMLIMLIGPILEERYGSLQLLIMILVTALITGLTNIVLGNMLVGASGIAFMMIILASTANIRQGDIPLTFIAVALIWLGGEVVQAVKNDDNISHTAHLIGGIAGGIFGFLSARAKVATIEKKPAALDLKELGLPAAKALPKKTAAK